MLKLPEERRRWGESKGTYRKGYYFYSPQSSTDGGYNNITNMNKVSPTQNTPALQAIRTLAVLNFLICRCWGLESEKLNKLSDTK